MVVAVAVANNQLAIRVLRVEDMERSDHSDNGCEQKSEKHK
jgi:hypothetical protein